MRSLVLYGPPSAGKRTIIEVVGKAREASFSLFTVTAGEPSVPHRVLQAVFQEGRHVLQLLTISGAVWSANARRHLFEGSDGLLIVLDSQATRDDANKACILDDVMSFAPDRGAVVFTKRDLADSTEHVLTGSRFNSWPRFPTHSKDLDSMFSAVSAALAI